MNKKQNFDPVFDTVNIIFFSFVLVLVLYPLYLIVISSFSNPTLVASGEVWIWPREITWQGYALIFQDSDIWMGYTNSLIYTVLGAAFSTVIVITGGYSLSRRDLPGKNAFITYILITMFFSGGMIPTYLLVKDLGMLNTIWAMVIPGSVSVFQLIIARTFFQSTVAEELQHAAEIDGASDFTFFFKIVVPLSLPLISIIVLFNAVSQWNAYFKALIYITEFDLFPLQLILRKILVQSEITDNLVDVASLVEQQRLSELIKYGVIIVASIPMLILYPFVQRFFVQGIMIGSVKG